MGVATSHPALLKGAYRKHGGDSDSEVFDVRFESTKVQAVLNILQEIKSKRRSEKTIVFVSRASTIRATSSQI